MSLDTTNGVGFFGKIPALGDFVSRRLPRSFIEPWDQWLQSAMHSSKEMLGEDWLSLYLVSPIWRFALSPGLCGPDAWAGVMMPSVDKVGRYYPLILVQNLDVESLYRVFLPESDWFEQLEQLALSVLNEDFDFAGFDEATLTMHFDQHLSPVGFKSQNQQNLLGTPGKQAYCYELEDLNQFDALFPSFCHQLITKHYSTYSYWAATDSHHQSRFLCCEAMPPIDAFASFLQGQPRHASWELQAYKLQNTSNSSVNSEFPNFEAASSSESDMFRTGQGWVSHGMTVVGNKRKHNEDAMLDSPNSGIWVVADGMGGHQSGDVASRLIVDSLANVEVDDNIETQSEWVFSRLNKINVELCRFASGIEPGAVVGSTVVVLLARGSHCTAIWAGDSRLYLFRKGKLRQLTRDHTLADEMMDLAKLTREEALQQVGANVITRAVGGHAELELDEISFLAESGDKYLLCSDGLDKELSETEITELMQEGDCRTVVEKLINQALYKNGRDNITAVVAEFL